MIKTRVNFNIDKLKLCYNQPSGLFEDLLSKFQSNEDGIIDYTEFYLKLSTTDTNDGGSINRMIVQVHYYMDSKDNYLGDFDFTTSAKYSGLCFFLFSNNALYTQFIRFGDKKHNVICFIDYISAQLGLELNNITIAEIALDTNVNFIPILRRYIKDFEQYDMIYNGVSIKDEERTIDNYGEYYSRSRKRISKQPTLYLHQKKEIGLELKVYNKSKEIKETDGKKDYITHWNDFGNRDIYRLELTARNSDIKAFCAYSGHLKEELVQLITWEDWRVQMWANCTHRLIYFRERKTGKEINLWDML